MDIINIGTISKAIFSGTAKEAAEKTGLSERTIRSYKANEKSKNYRNWKGMSLETALEVMKKMEENKMNIANLELVEVLLSGDVTTNEIETKTGVDSSIIESVRNKEIEVEDLSFKSAIALTNYAINQIDIKSAELLNWMKFKKESFDYVVRDKDGDFLKNSDTSNLQSIFSIDAGTDEHFYGAYGDLVANASGQVDSRENTDEEIKAAIKKMLMKGNAVLHS